MPVSPFEYSGDFFTELSIAMGHHKFIKHFDGLQFLHRIPHPIQFHLLALFNSARDALQNRHEMCQRFCALGHDSPFSKEVLRLVDALHSLFHSSLSFCMHFFGFTPNFSLFMNALLPLVFLFLWRILCKVSFTTLWPMEEVVYDEPLYVKPYFRRNVY